MTGNCFVSKCDQFSFYLNCLFNARSVVANLSEFQYVLYSCNYDIILVTETWLTADDTNGLLDPEGNYVIERVRSAAGVGAPAAGRCCRPAPGSSGASDTTAVSPRVYVGTSSKRVANTV